MACTNPDVIYNKYLDKWVSVPCGKCEACLVSKQLDLTNRVRNEVEQHSYNLFFTLTYDNEHIPYILPISPCVHSLDGRFSNEFHDLVYDSKIMSNINNCDWLQIDATAVLYYKDVQKFFKDLRYELYKKLISNGYEKEKAKEFAKVRYCVCGEYGSSTNRPHYHGILHFHTFEVSEICRLLIPEVWKLCNWSALVNDWIEKGRPAKKNPLPTYCGVGAAVSYVSKYVSYYSGSSPFMEIGLFKPFFKTSRKPLYGVSTFDKTVYEEAKTLSCEVHKRILYSSGNNFISSTVLFSKRFLASIYPKFFGFDVSDLWHTFELLCFAPFERIRNKYVRYKRLIIDRYKDFNFHTFCDYVYSMEFISRRFNSMLLYNQMSRFKKSDFLGYLSENSDGFNDKSLMEIFDIVSAFLRNNGIYKRPYNVVAELIYSDRSLVTQELQEGINNNVSKHRKCLYGKHVSSFSQFYNNTV